MTSASKTSPWARPATFLLSAVVVVSSTTARAIDTHEPFNVGVTNIEVYAGTDSDEWQTLRDFALPTSTFVLGIGLSKSVGVYAQSQQSPRLNAWASGSAKPSLSIHDSEAGAVWTFNTRHVDVDVQHSVVLPSGGFERAHVVTFAELNLDTHDDLSGVGVFSRVGVDVARPDARALTVDAALVFGAYASPRPGHQILVRLNAVQPSTVGVVNAALVLTPLLPGRLAVGYNVVVNPVIEIIAQVSTPIRPSLRAPHVTASIGVVVTLPGNPTRIRPRADLQLLHAPNQAKEAVPQCLTC